jgi:hypothetical protein
MALDIGAIKTAFKTAFDAANTTTASYDLSTGLTDRVKSVFTVMPNTENMNAGVLPAITIWTESKTVDMRNICKNQLTAKRQATAIFNVAGVLWNSNFSNAETDLADNDIEKLMENIEEILRRNDTLGNTVLWQHPTNVTYHNLSRSEEEHYRVGIATVECVIFY